MKKFPRLLPLCLLAALLPAVFTACSGGFDASAYVKAGLNNMYLDESADYTEITDCTAEEAHETHLNGLKAEAEVFYNYMYFDTSCLTEETEARVLDMYSDIYKHAKYEVQDANKSNNGYTVVVKIYPIDIFDQSMDELTAMVDVMNEKSAAGAYAGLTDEEIEQEYQNGILDIIESHIDTIDYLDPVEQTVQIKEDSDGLWGMSDQDFSNIDTYIIQY